MNHPPLPFAASDVDDVDDETNDPIERLKSLVPEVALWTPSGDLHYVVPEPEPRHEIVLITPELAAQWLTINPINRTLRDDFVRELIGIIKRGEWRLNGETIKFGWDDSLIDGQHRLEAIRLANTAVPNLVVYDLPPDTQETVDTGRRRQMSDTLKMRGETNTISLAATLNRLYCWSIGDIALKQPTRFKLTAPQALAMLERDPLIRDSLHYSQRIHQLNERHMAQSMIATTYHRFRAIDLADAQDFWERYATGHGAPHKHPIDRLRRAMSRNAAKRGQKHTPYMIHAWIVKAWNAYRMGKTEIGALVFRPGGSSPERFPEPR